MLFSIEAAVEEAYEDATVDSIANVEKVEEAIEKFLGGFFATSTR